MRDVRRGVQWPSKCAKCLGSSLTARDRRAAHRRRAPARRRRATPKRIVSRNAPRYLSHPRLRRTRLQRGPDPRHILPRPLHTSTACPTPPLPPSLPGPTRPPPFAMSCKSRKVVQRLARLARPHPGRGRGVEAAAQPSQRRVLARLAVRLAGAAELLLQPTKLVVPAHRWSRGAAREKARVYGHTWHARAGGA